MYKDLHMHFPPFHSHGHANGVDRLSSCTKEKTSSEAKCLSCGFKVRDQFSDIKAQVSSCAYPSTCCCPHSVGGGKRNKAKEQPSAFSDAEDDGQVENQQGCSFFLKFIIYFAWVCVCMCDCHTSGVLMVTRRVHHIPWSWDYRWLWTAMHGH